MRETKSKHMQFKVSRWPCSSNSKQSRLSSYWIETNSNWSLRGAWSNLTSARPTSQRTQQRPRIRSRFWDNSCSKLNFKREASPAKIWACKRTWPTTWSIRQKLVKFRTTKTCRLRWVELSQLKNETWLRNSSKMWKRWVTSNKTTPQDRSARSPTTISKATSSKLMTLDSCDLKLTNSQEDLLQIWLWSTMAQIQV